jgi:geranylgeranyl diphosphate synthase type II
MQSFSGLVQSFESRFATTLPFPEQPTALYEPCRYLLQLGGKRIRPVLCLMACELFENICDDAWYAANAVELFHNFTLIHDDIMDKAPLRRGQPTLHHKYGLTAGILCGDVMCIYAYEQLAHVKRNLPQILQLFNKTAIEVCEGQQMDMDFESRNDVSIEEYIKMITLKTSVLLACSLKIGALCGGALGDNARKLYDFGRNMGIAFQLQDDYLDAFGETAKLGKQNGGDIRANKKTYLLLKAQENADVSQRKQIDDLLLQEASDEKVAQMLALYTATGADAACKKAIEEYSNLAFFNLEDVAIPSARRKPLMELAQYLLIRDK